MAEGNKRSSNAPAKPAAIEAFLSDADKGKSKERAASGSTTVVTREKDDSVVYEARDEKSKAIVHRNYVKKQ